MFWGNALTLQDVPGLLEECLTTAYASAILCLWYGKWTISQVRCRIARNRKICMSTLWQSNDSEGYYKTDVPLKVYSNWNQNVQNWLPITDFLVWSLANDSKRLCVTKTLPCLQRIRMMSAVLASMAWWRHEMDTLSALWALCTAIQPVSHGFSIQRANNIKLSSFLLT